MQIKPILAALSRHRTATVLIVLQVALTLAIVCNALFIAQQRVAYLSRPTGIDEAHIAVIHNQWIGQLLACPRTNASMLAQTLPCCGGLPGVADYVCRLFLSGRWARCAVAWHRSRARTAACLVGRVVLRRRAHAFNARTEARRRAATSTLTRSSRSTAADATPAPPSIIVTRDLADTLFPQGGALGTAVFIGEQAQHDHRGDRPFCRCPPWALAVLRIARVLMPNHGSPLPATPYYLVRAKPGPTEMR